MKQILSQYLASLKESGELDVIIPDLLSDRGFTVYSRPQIGVPQYGVDVMATGLDPDSKEKTLYLITIKSGNLTKTNWDSGQNAIRPSINEILDTQLPLYTSGNRENLPIKVIICIGGELKQEVNSQVVGYCKSVSEKNNVPVEVWNGDHLANIFLSSDTMNETIFTKRNQKIIRKVLATSDDPDICIRNFNRLLEKIVSQRRNTIKVTLQAVRTVYIAMSLIFSDCKKSGNIESAYRCVTRGTLSLWQLCTPVASESKSFREKLFSLRDEMVSLYISVSREYLNLHISPFCLSRDALALSVETHSSVAVNLKLFEALGRVSIMGLWLCQEKSLVEAESNSFCEINKEIDILSKLLMSMIDNNPVFYSPLRDDHAIEIVLTSLFLEKSGNRKYLICWLSKITDLSIFSFRENLAYPCILTDYRKLSVHPQNGQNYKKAVTQGSILYPTLSVLLARIGDTETFYTLNYFYTTDMQHSTWQLWVPDDLTEQHLYRNTALHGQCICDLKLDSPEELIDQLKNEAKVNHANFAQISAIKQEFSPIVLMACQLHRIPVPIQFMILDV